MNLVIFASPSDVRTRDVAQAAALCYASCTIFPLPVEGTEIPADALILVLDTPERSAARAILDIRRNALQPVPVLVVAAFEERAYSARLIAHGATVVLPPGCEIESVCAEVRAIQHYRSSKQPLDTLQPFIAGAIESFEMMAQVRVQLERVGVCADTPMHGDMTALIYLLGEWERVLTLSCSNVAATNLARKILNDTVEIPSPAMVEDALGEMLNIIAGLVRSRQRAGGDDFEITTPTVIRGDNHRLSFRADLPGLEMVLSSRLGYFAMRLGHRAWET